MAKKKTIYGVIFMAALTGFSWPRMVLLMILKRIKAMRPPAKGEINQLATICPILPQWTEPIPAATMPKPATAPTMEWVVETGMPVQVAKLSQIAADNRAADIPMTRRAAGSPSSMPGIEARAEGSTIPLRIVSVTWEPTRTAPANSQIPAAMTAFFMDNAPEPTASAM